MGLHRLSSVLLLCVSLPLAAGYQQGMDAYNSGNYSKAFVEWLLVASETGKGAAVAHQAEAQFALSFLYSEGKGVPQDRARAGFWLKKAAENGHPVAREMLAARLGKQPPKPVSRPRQQTSSAAAGGQDFKTPQWILSQDPARYTVQLAAVSRQSDLQKMVAGHQGLQPFASFPLQRDGKTLQVLIQGVYPNRKAAEDAAGNYPQTLTGGSEPWIRRFRGIQQVLKDQQ